MRVTATPASRETADQSAAKGAARSLHGLPRGERRSPPERKSAWVDSETRPGILTRSADRPGGRETVRSRIGLASRSPGKGEARRDEPTGRRGSRRRAPRGPCRRVGERAPRETADQSAPYLNRVTVTPAVYPGAATGRWQGLGPRETADQSAPYLKRVTVTPAVYPGVPTGRWQGLGPRETADQSAPYLKRVTVTPAV